MNGPALHHERSPVSSSRGTFSQVRGFSFARSSMYTRRKGQARHRAGRPAVLAQALRSSGWDTRAAGAYRTILAEAGSGSREAWLMPVGEYVTHARQPVRRTASPWRAVGGRGRDGGAVLAPPESEVAVARHACPQESGPGLRCVPQRQLGLPYGIEYGRDRSPTGCSPEHRGASTTVRNSGGRSHPCGDSGAVLNQLGLSAGAATAGG